VAQLVVDDLGREEAGYDEQGAHCADHLIAEGSRSDLGKAAAFLDPSGGRPIGNRLDA
jgi:hypothetical protein